MASLRNRAQDGGSASATLNSCGSAPSAKSPCHPNPRGSSTKNAKKPRTISKGPQLEPIWEHTEAGWWIVEYNGMLRSGPFATKEQGRGWFYKELDIKLGI